MAIGTKADFLKELFCKSIIALVKSEGFERASFKAEVPTGVLRSWLAESKLPSQAVMHKVLTRIHAIPCTNRRREAIEAQRARKAQA